MTQLPSLFGITGLTLPLQTFKLSTKAVRPSLWQGQAPPDPQLPFLGEQCMARPFPHDALAFKPETSSCVQPQLRLEAPTLSIKK